MPEQGTGELNTNIRERHQELVSAGREILLAAPQLYIDVDVEADGKPGYGSLLSIGATTVDDERFYIEMKPDGELYVPSQRQFCEEHNLERERLVREGVDTQDAITQFVDWTNDQIRRVGKPVVFSAFNAGYDFGFIDLYCAKYGLKNPYGIAPFDLKSKLLALDGNWDWKATSKDKLPDFLLPEGDFTHKADEDTLYQQQILFATVGYIAEQANGR